MADVSGSRKMDHRLVRDDAFVHHQHAIGQQERLLDVVGDQQHGAPVQRPQVGDLRLRGQPGQRVQRRERLVEQQQSPVAAPAPWPARRVAPHPRTDTFGQTSVRWLMPTSASAASARCRSGRPGSPRTTFRQTLFQGSRRGDWKATARAVATSATPSTSWSRSAEHSKQRALAAAAGAEQHHELAGRDIEIEIGQDLSGRRTTSTGRAPGPRTARGLGSARRSRRPDVSLLRTSVAMTTTPSPRPRTSRSAIRPSRAYSTRHSTIVSVS